MPREIIKEFLLSLTAKKNKEAATPQSEREGEKWHCFMHMCPRFYAQISQMPHKRQECISSSRATLMSKHEHRQQGEAFLERQVQNYSAHCSCAVVFEPSPETLMICRKTEDSMLFVLAGLQLEAHLWGIETQTDLLAS